jgi:hypothetical protein
MSQQCLARTPGWQDWGFTTERNTMLHPKRWARRLSNDRGAATAEYAITILAAVGFAGLLVVILRSDAVRKTLTDLVQHALSFAG